jgi:hypothetical protein
MRGGGGGRQRHCCVFRLDPELLFQTLDQSCGPRVGGRHGPPVVCGGCEGVVNSLLRSLNSISNARGPFPKHWAGRELCPTPFLVWSLLFKPTHSFSPHTSASQQVISLPSTPHLRGRENRTKTRASTSKEVKHQGRLSPTPGPRIIMPCAPQRTMLLAFMASLPWCDRYVCGGGAYVCGMGNA